MNVGTGTRAGKRDVALTTLIDLLVQVVFVFTLLLVASGVMDGFVSMATWQKLVRTLSISSQASPELQADEIARRMAEAIEARAKVEKEVDDLRKEREELRRRIAELDAKVADLGKKLGAPGYPPCRAPDFSEQVVAQIRIDRNGQIEVREVADTKSHSAYGLTAGAFGLNLSRSDFSQRFEAWRQTSTKRETPCLFSATMSFDPATPAGEYQPSFSRVRSIFYLRSVIAERS